MILTRIRPPVSVTPNLRLSLLYINVYSFGDLYIVVAGDGEFKGLTMEDLFDTIVNSCEPNTTGCETANNVEICTKAVVAESGGSNSSGNESDADSFADFCPVASGNDSSSIVYSIDDDLNVEESGSSTKRKDSEAVAECENSVLEIESNTDSSSSVSDSSERPGALVAESKVLSFLGKLSDMERSDLNMALCGLTGWSAGEKVPLLERVKMHSVLRMAYRRKLSGEQETLETPLMAVAINWMGIDNAICHIYPIIEEYYLAHSDKEDLGFIFI
ncbi:hypothetical protein H4218_005966 [Coemansia sp. IMI 209128]|nr:hypothetical protein H4218_005966 [Coemansia sp. IMI 209128]